MTDINKIKDIIKKNIKSLEQQIKNNNQIGVKQYLEGQRDAYLEVDDFIELIINKEI